MRHSGRVKHGQVQWHGENGGVASSRRGVEVQSHDQALSSDQELDSGHLKGPCRAMACEAQGNAKAMRFARAAVVRARLDSVAPLASSLEAQTRRYSK